MRLLFDGMPPPAVICGNKMAGIAKPVYIDDDDSGRKHHN